MATEEEEIRKEVELFYTSLYTPAQVDMAAAEALQAIASPSLASCSTEAQADLVRTITLKEVRATLKEAPKGKAPGPGNLPVEVYRLLQAPLGPEMTRLFNWCLNKGHQFPGGNKVKICLIFMKKGATQQTKELEAHQPLKRGLQIAHPNTIK
ncbi:hypothetical protein DSO57_1035785 [Entomophthora muscae]|uniref:Uncharacterized protein n=1 Tax=Entomophthora muscae TaxID=34485 RepID=A0ACC2UJF1_9FUNG|nr:hypothetical protein DSO57_1035785 [Entomophthora muscae]